MVFLKINDNNKNLTLQNVHQAYHRVNKNAGLNTNHTQGDRDFFDISQETQSLISYTSQVSCLPEIRNEVVSAIRKSLANHTYKINPEEIASGILRELKQEKY